MVAPLDLARPPKATSPRSRIKSTFLVFVLDWRSTESSDGWYIQIKAIEKDDLAPLDSARPPKAAVVSEATSSFPNPGARDTCVEPGEREEAPLFDEHRVRQPRVARGRVVMGGG